ncbi:ABC transporter ATP-binding protein [Tannerella serpentiformis]|uniref:ABC transporter ATP-binding protein n=1 Tax=Tannerella serpentiformis TaxID=712710 RepID=UPI000840C7C6|nr:ABC transporter ATP-binding protein [Tannerella serpentiformis]AOH40935.1 ABC transporter ATP-binding protein [Tannerella serpentiformis]AVV52605.1 ABC transporter ATP-binding protein [Tannerella serpentiformis]
MKETTIRLRDLSIGYPDKHNTKRVAEHLNASIHSGELTCLLGTNGVGKSTLLRTLSAFQPPLGGTIDLLDRPLSTYDDRQLATVIGVVLTEKSDIRNMTVEELVGLGRSPYTGFWGTLKEGDRKIVHEAIARVRIEPLTQRMVHTLSDGERQKVMIAKALAQETPIIFLDEPTAFLDFPSKVEVMQLLHNLTHTLQKTVFMSTHDLELALQIADKIWLMDRTNGIAIGTPEDLSLEGKLSSFFSRKGITYDTETGFFRIDTDYRREIHLHGHGSRYAMVRKALQRNGIRADRHVADDSLHIDTTGSAGDPFVIHRADGSTQSATNIEALLSLIADQ